jgi:hypothetical protein
MHVLLLDAATTVRAESGNGSSEYDYDIITIGAGSGGVRASRFATSYGEHAGAALARNSTSSTQTVHWQLHDAAATMSLAAPAQQARQQGRHLCAAALAEPHPCSSNMLGLTCQKPMHWPVPAVNREQRKLHTLQISPKH